jgi:hypothetical protein
MSDIDLEELYNQSKKDGLIETVQTDDGSSVDLESLYEQSKKGFVAESTQQELAEKPNLIKEAAKEGLSAMMNPNASQMTPMGLDVAGRGAMAMANSAYGGLKEHLLNTPQAKGMVSGLSDKPGPSLIRRQGQAPVTLPSQQQVGRGAQGLGIDIAATIASEGAVNVGGNLLGKAKLPSQMSGLIPKTKEIFNSGKNLSKASVESERLYQEIESLRDSISPARDALKDASINDAVLYKNKLRPVSKENSKIYREGLDLAEKSANITQSKVSSILEQSIDEALEQGVNENSALITAMKEELGNIKPGSKTRFDYESLTNVADVEDSKLSLEAIRNLKSRLFKVADKSQDHADEVGNAIFMKNYGKEIASQSSEFQAMQSEYAPFVEAKKWAYRTFKPFTKDEIPNGNRVLKRIASGSANAEDFAYLKRLENGSGRFKGTGEMRQSSQSMADSLRNISDDIKNLRRQKVKNSNDIQKLKHMVGIRDKMVIGSLAMLGALGVGAKNVYKTTKDLIS